MVQIIAKREWEQEMKEPMEQPRKLIIRRTGILSETMKNIKRLRT
jgi:hypothetical protein